MKNILKLFLLSILVTVVFTGCSHEDVEWTTGEPSFKLNDTSLGAENTLYKTMSNNPFTLVWESIGNGEYKVELSATSDFVKKIELGSSTETSFTTTIGNLNTKLLQLGFSPFTSQLVYIRIEKGLDVSNTISFGVKVYPVDGPVITAPANGSTITLNSANQAAIATTITWNDYSNYGSPVTYTVEIAKKGSATFSQLGVVTSSKSFPISNKNLNNAALTVGGVANTEGEFDFRITAKTSFSTPAIELKSSVVTAKMKPYQVDYPDFYLVGGATAVGWTPSSAQKLYKKDNMSIIYTYLQPDNFRFLGQQSWSGKNYSLNDPGIKSDYQYFKSWSSNLAPETVEKENIKFAGTAGIYKIEINADLSVQSITVTSSNITSWDIPNLYLVGSINSWTPASATEFSPLGNGVFETYAQLPDNSEFKFIGQKSWGNLEWGNINKNNDGNSGYLGPKDENSNIKFSGGNSYYKITVDLKMGTYRIDPL